MRIRYARPLVVLVSCAVLSFGLARHRRSLGRGDVSRSSSLPAGAIEAHVPHLTGSITLDGDTDDPGWRGASLRTGAWVAADGVTPVHPHTEARAVWGDGFLYMNLYAADEDIRAAGQGSTFAPDDDFFHLVFTGPTTEWALDVSPLGVMRSGSRPRGAERAFEWSASGGGVHVSHEIDGTPNHPGDNDEEWVLELAIPFESLGLDGKPGEQVGLAMERCDTPHRGARVCGSWGEGNAPRVLVLDDVLGARSATQPPSSRARAPL